MGIDFKSDRFNNQDIKIGYKEDGTCAFHLKGNGDIIINGRLIENDKEIVEALREMFFIHDANKNREFSLEQLIKFGYYVRKNPHVVMRENYINWINGKKATEL